MKIILNIAFNPGIYLEVKTWLFDKRPRKFSPSSINARSRAGAWSYVVHIISHDRNVVVTYGTLLLASQNYVHLRFIGILLLPFIL